ncbi:hypothetical protein AB0F43_03605 [Kribbella sp. NPDC023972]|uniref:hypothetical protein n=1 Tax=Kribbella sp. NPDC023972 TaxID=3154795 RepID=UPI0033EE4E4E
MQNPAWTRLTAAVPWLAQLPPEVPGVLDLDELVVPDGIVASVRAGLERSLSHHVMTYRADAVPRPGHLQLCTILVPAALSPGQLELLRQTESALASHRVVLCAYARPLTIRPTYAGSSGSAGSAGSGSPPR